MLSVIICTYNRADMLSYCLDSFALQTASIDLFQIIVVDNSSTDGTKEVVDSFRTVLPNILYTMESNIGLSHARNRGYKEATFDWVSYVDDDAKAYPNYIERALYTIKNFEFDCFGGRFLPWYLEPKPKWLPNELGEFPLLRKDVGILTAGMHAAGGVIVFRKKALIEVGGFPSNLGMSGNEVGYGEENWVQDEMRKKSYIIGFDPELKIDHLVASYKFTLWWHFKRQWAKGRAAKILQNRQKQNPAAQLGWALAVTLKELIINLPKWVLKSDYYYQNYILNSVGFLIRTVGFLKKPN